MTVTSTLLVQLINQRAEMCERSDQLLNELEEVDSTISEIDSIISALKSGSTVKGLVPPNSLPGLEDDTATPTAEVQDYDRMTSRAAMRAYFISTGNQPTHRSKLPGLIGKHAPTVRQYLSMYPEFVQAPLNGTWKLSDEWYGRGHVTVGR